MANRNGAAAAAAAAALLMIASLLVAVTLADARVAVRRSQFGDLVVAEAAVPELTCSEVHGVQAGETCDAVAQAAGLTQDRFFGLNPDIDCDGIFVGQWLCLAGTSE